MRFLACGSDAVLVELAGLDEALALARSLAARPIAGVIDVVPGARTVLLVLSPAADRARVRREVAERTGDQATPDEVETVEVPVVYDGEDVTEVAALTGLSESEVIARHAAAAYEVAFTGFAPGFAYLAGLDPALHVPRRATPRQRIPAGAVAIAGEFTGVYPAASPGGWRLLGRALDEMWNLERTPPALLRPGMRVRFVAVDEPDGAVAAAAPVSKREGPRPDEESSRSGPLEVNAASPHALLAGGGRPGRAARGAVASDGAEPSFGALEVLAASPHALIEDVGRPGRAALGVAPSGAMDRAALRRANQLLGNDPGAAAIETALGGLRLRAHGPLTVAVAGAPAEMTIVRRGSERGPEAPAADAPSPPSHDLHAQPTESVRPSAPAASTPSGAHNDDPQRESPAPFDAPFALAAGDELVVGPAMRGVYSYVAVRGGPRVDPVLGSASRDVLAGLGPTPLVAGDVIEVGRNQTSAVAEWSAPPEPLPSSGDVVEVDVVPGPRDDWFAGLDALTAQDWTVSPRSNRVGLRLEGTEALVRSRTDELPSEGTVTGAVQVPPDGQPIVFAADRPLTGGYPVIAVVAREHLSRVAQAPPGALIRFRIAR